MAATDVRPRVLYATVLRLEFPLYDSAGALKSGASGLDSEISIDGAGFADCAAEATEIGSTGIYYLDLSTTETTMLNSAVVQIKGSDVRTHVVQLVLDQDVRMRKAQAGAAGTITLDASASATDDLFNGLAVEILSGTGVGQTRLVYDYVGSTKVASIAPNWTTNPDSTSIFHLRQATAADVRLWLGATAPAMTGDAFARLGAPAGASVSADVAAVKADTAAIGAAGAGLTAIPWNAAWDAEVQSEVNDALVVLGLDHLVSAAVVGADVADNSIIAKMVSKSATADWDSFVNTTDALEALRDRGDAAWITATGFSTHSASDVWAVATRLLTAGTNIALAKGVGVTGFNDLDAAGIRAAVGLASANLDTQLAALPTVAGIADAVWDEDATGHQTGGTFGQAIGDPGANTNTIFAATVNDALGASVGTDTAEILTRMGTPSNLGTGGTLAANLVDIEGQTDDIGVAGAGLTGIPWNAAWDAEVQSEVDDALVALRLDHLVAVADADDAVDNSIIAKLASKGATADWSSFVNTTDSLEAIRDRGDAAWTTAVGFPTAATIADAVWDEAVADHVAAGSTGERLERLDIIASGGAGGLTNARAALLDNLDTAVSTRSSHAAADIWAVGTRTLTALGFVMGAADIGPDAIGASELAADAANEIADAILDRSAGVETGLTPRQLFRLLASFAGGLTSGFPTAPVFRDINDSKNRIVASLDSSGNRLVLTLDLA